MSVHFSSKTTEARRKRHNIVQVLINKQTNKWNGMKNKNNRAWSTQNIAPPRTQKADGSRACSQKEGSALRALCSACSQGCFLLFPWTLPASSAWENGWSAVLMVAICFCNCAAYFVPICLRRQRLPQRGNFFLPSLEIKHCLPLARDFFLQLLPATAEASLP